ncbi:20827_t:CDS:1, partial [Dentiscutata erythropus]
SIQKLLLVKVTYHPIGKSILVTVDIGFIKCSLNNGNSEQFKKNIEKIGKNQSWEGALLPDLIFDIQQSSELFNKEVDLSRTDPLLS